MRSNPRCRPHLDVKLIAEDAQNYVAEAYVKKQAIGFMNAARRAEAAKTSAMISHGRATLGQPRLPSSVGGLASDWLGTRSRGSELYHQPPLTPISRHAHVVNSITGTYIAEEASAGAPATEQDAQGNPITPYEASRLRGIAINNAMLQRLGLGPGQGTIGQPTAAEAEAAAEIEAQMYDDDDPNPA
ncbi:hypothetical protein T492DRAFT_890009 [Pavlovales sp. CCMP2436]|nr:hypothetical protein T492DRAFT_890009 [Pavlovales sp. CCMP2436]